MLAEDVVPQALVKSMIDGRLTGTTAVLFRGEEIVEFCM